MREDQRWGLERKKSAATTTAEDNQLTMKKSPNRMKETQNEPRINLRQSEQAIYLSSPQSSFLSDDCPQCFLPVLWNRNDPPAKFFPFCQDRCSKTERKEQKGLVVPEGEEGCL